MKDPLTARRQEVVAYKPVDGTRPAFIGIAAHIDALKRYHACGVGVAHDNVHIEDQIGDLLDPPAHREIGAQLIGEICVAAVAGPQVGGFGLRRDRGNINNGNSSGFRQLLTQLIRFNTVTFTPDPGFDSNRSGKVCLASR